MLDRTFRRVFPAVLMLVGTGMVWSARSQSAIPLAAPLTTVLPSYEDLRVTNTTVSEEERRIAGMSDYIARSYWRPDSTLAFTAYVGYYDKQSQGKTMHSPKNCLPGAGWEILKANTGAITVNGGQYVVNKNLLKNGSAQALVLYWYQGRGRVVANEYAVKLNLLRDAAFKGHTEEALVRIMIPITGAGKLDAAALERALADADALGTSISQRLLTEVARAVPSDGTAASVKTIGRL